MVTVVWYDQRLPLLGTTKAEGQVEELDDQAEQVDQVHRVGQGRVARRNDSQQESRSLDRPVNFSSDTRSSCVLSDRT